MEIDDVYLTQNYKKTRPNDKKVTFLILMLQKYNTKQFFKNYASILFSYITKLY